MPLSPSTLSQAARAVADFLKYRINGSTAETDPSHVSVFVGSPAKAAPASGESKHRLNLFFYLVDPSPFHNDAALNEVWRLRLHCLITAFTAPETISEGEEDIKIEAGENDLRRLGEVIRIFHEKPILDAVDMGGLQVRLDVIFRPIKLEELNHLWTTQGDVPYRPSLAYEMGLIPLVPREKSVPAPKVGAVGVEAFPDLQPPLPGTFGGFLQYPPVARVDVPQAREDWEPAVCLVYQNRAVRSLALTTSQAATLVPAVWVAGKIGAEVRLRWQTWTKDEGWQEASVATITPTQSIIDPAAVAGAATQTLTLPLSGPGQAQLVAERDRQRQDGVVVPLRGEPVLITIYSG